MKKYEVVSSATIKHLEVTLPRRRRLSDGAAGGYLESEANLSHEGECWVSGLAHVSGEARVSGSAPVSGSDKRLTLNIEHGAWAARRCEGLNWHLLKVFAAVPILEYQRNSDTWVVFGVRRKGWKRAVHDLAVFCGEECISAYSSDTGKGRYLGPKASDWGQFSPALFTYVEDI